MKILLIEDDSEIANTLKESLENNYIVKISLTGHDGELQAQTNEYDIILLDLSLPDKDGLAVCKRIRKRKIETPILILTGKADIQSKVELLDNGADDYLTKPFKLEELTARIRALLRRKQKNLTENTIATEDIMLDLNKKTAKRGDYEVNLRKKEYYLLEYLVKNAGNVVSRSMIMDHVWEDDSEAVTNVVDVHIKYLRDRIDKPFSKKLIKTIYGMGYRFEV